MTARGRGGSEGGFTLLEVLAALVILALSMGALLQLFSTGLRGLGAAEDHAMASLLAESWLEGLGAGRAIEEGEASGIFDARYSWRAVVRPLVLDERADRAAAWPVTAYEIELSVLWDEGRAQRSLSLSTLRLVANP
jgi:general secretion pathway protein I